ncbi:hypothetical protein RQM47_13865 [Rubrivirga sp. S365]|uniref:MetA-pathway of phenol degradation n=1 Tax=Rubrivirga litoralis TaxID=3075598 RepID=A0ABU3BMN0_9BACT|nr:MULTISPECIES: hypothetical protein [unclassified Rubrivirga]MDT0630554.1 hypothetical protein [Rubrivirga sp. F394]MDT7857734.1 hypothetical protein [Rubrivirga sp. S365]
MTNVLLSGLLAGTFALGAPADDASVSPVLDVPSDSVYTAAFTPAPADVSDGVFAQDEEAETPRSITQDTYAFGTPSAVAPIKLWVTYGYGQVDDVWDTRGEDAELQVAGTNGDIVTQRLTVGGQINFVSFPVFQLGGGAQLNLAKNKFERDDAAGGLLADDIESSFGLQSLKVFGSARGRVVGLHGGYIFDLGDAREFGAAVDTPFGPVVPPTELATSGGRDAIFFGADFDVPSDHFRVFGGIDYYMLQDADNDENTAFDESTYQDDDILNMLLGAGVKISVFELGAALQIQTRLNNPTVLDVGNTRGIGSHAGTVSPYLRITPPSFPAAFFVKGAVLDEYTEFGYPIGGANSIKPSVGFTAGLTVGFE